MLFAGIWNRPVNRRIKSPHALRAISCPVCCAQACVYVQSQAWTCSGLALGMRGTLELPVEMVCLLCDHVYLPIIYIWTNMTN